MHTDGSLVKRHWLERRGCLQAARVLRNFVIRHLEANLETETVGLPKVMSCIVASPFDPLAEKKRTILEHVDFVFDLFVRSIYHGCKAD